MEDLMTTLKDKSRILVAGHRGCRALYPENTLLSMKEALDRKVDMIEFDLNLTRDKVVVVMHDNTVDRTTDGTGYIHDMTLKEIKALDAGVKSGKVFEGLHVPTLREFCDLIAPYKDLLLNVEIKEKTHETVDLSMEILKEYGLVRRSVFTCFDASIVAYLHDAYGVKTQGFPKEKMQNFEEGANGTYSKMTAVGIDVKILTPELVREFEDRGILVWSYCPDTEELAEESVRLGARLMTCNDPRPALRVTKRQGLHFRTLSDPEL